MGPEQGGRKTDWRQALATSGRWKRLQRPWGGLQGTTLEDFSPSPVSWGLISYTHFQWHRKIIIHSTGSSRQIQKKQLQPNKTLRSMLTLLLTPLLSHADGWGLRRQPSSMTDKIKKQFSLFRLHICMAVWLKTFHPVSYKYEAKNYDRLALKASLFSFSYLKLAIHMNVFFHVS